MSSCRPPPLGPGAVANFLMNNFPFESVEEDSVEILAGYDDRNYKFKGSLKPVFSNCKVVSKDCQYVLKFLNSRDSADIEVVDGLTALSKFLFESGRFECPYPVPPECCAAEKKAGSGGNGMDMVVMKHSDLVRHYCVATASNSVTNGGIVDQSTSDDSFKNADGSGTHCAAAVQPNDTATLLTSHSDRLYCVRVFVYVEGELLGYEQHSQELLWDFGCYIGRMNKAMRTFSHSALERRYNKDWDLKYFLTKRDTLQSLINDPVKEKTLGVILDEFEKHVQPIINNDGTTVVEYGCVHNDLNCLNIITRTDDKNNLPVISGVIDLTDCCFCPYVFELGIATAYLMTRRDDPVSYVKPFIQGYLSEFSLSKASLNVLYYVILGRMAQSYINAAYAFQFDPSNTYILFDAEPFWNSMNRLLAEGKEQCYKCWEIS